MNEVTMFNFESHEVRTVLIDNEPWFVGKDVADTLGYSAARNALKNHVADEDKLTH
ncbi:Prophage antirepressor [Fructobacillus tropaeoli]|nr:Prophage antirepressor [Fructobacillus tropaeoli]